MATLFTKRVTMVNMDLKTAVMSYQLCLALPGFAEPEKDGGKRMLILFLESVRSELQFAFNSTEVSDFNRAITALNEAISLVESGQPENASQRIAAAISASTTPAQNAWQVLSEHGLL
jgi:hypothetical protein